MPFRDPGSWSEQTYADRRGDMELVIGEMLADPEFGPQTDRRRTGVAGRLLGGYMVLGLAGGWTSWRGARAPRVTAQKNHPWKRSSICPAPGPPVPLFVAPFAPVLLAPCLLSMPWGLCAGASGFNA